MTHNINLPDAAAEAENQRFIVKVYGWMSLALIVTGMTAIWVASNEFATDLLLASKYVFIGLLLLEFILVAGLTGWIRKMSPEIATFIFLAYSWLNGVTLSVIFLTYTTDSIADTFFITAGTFAVMSLIGYVTKTDLTSLGNLLLMALIGLIIATAINFFFRNETFYWITTFAGILIFTGLIAYDTQKIKKMNIIGNEGTDEDRKEAIIGALALYLDFINLFLQLLRLFGRRK
jgi:FtsH-binding integral membrane protein